MNQKESDLLTVGDLVPDLSLPTLEGSTINLREFRGRKLIIFMWASW